MSPLYENIRIPADQAASFEAFVANAGGLIKNRRDVPDERLFTSDSSLWSEQITATRTLLDQFHINHEDSNINEGILRGVELLVKASLPKTFSQNEDIEPDWTALGAKIHAVFNELPDDIPAGVHLVEKEGEPFFKIRGRHGVVLLPEGVMYTLDKYGLSDGQQKTYKEVAKKYNVKRSKVIANVATTRSDVAHRIRHLVLN